MKIDFEKKLRELGIEISEPNAPAANYVTYNFAGGMLFVAGQTCRENGQMKFVGKIGKDFSVEEGKLAARLCGVNLLAQIKHACGGDLNKVKKIVRLGVFVNCADDFVDHAVIANGVSDLMAEVFGERGKHARTSSGANSLPGNSAVEVDAIVELEI